MSNINEFPDSDSMILNEEGTIILSTGDVVLSDEELKLIYANQQGSVIRENKLLVYDSLSIDGWKLVQLNILDEVLANSRETIQTTILIGILFLVLAELFALTVAWQISKPVSELMSKMKQVESGDFDTSIAINSKDEIGLLARRFNKMVHRLEGLVQRIQHDEQEKRELELIILHEQINPHFLYNTLNSMVWLSRIQKAPAITEGLKSLIHLLKNTIHNGDETITVSDEIEFIKNYIVIQKLRYGDRFTVTYEVDATVEHCKILKLLIQPIIENAILHGIDLESFENTIHIRVEAFEGCLRFSVRDNGIGMDEGVVKKLMTDDVPNNDGLRHIGISNIIQRINLHYGDAYYLTLDSEVDTGTTVYVVLPILK
jgi:two-component system sensor histidine kinase YesM